MKITGIQTQLYAYDLARPIGDANSPRGRSRGCDLAVQIQTDEGLTGVSIGQAAAQRPIHALTDLLIGSDPRQVRGLWHRMVNRVFKGGNEGSANDAIGCLDVALWDLKAKANGEPLFRTLGAATRRVKIYASGIDAPLSDAELRRYYASMAKLGISAGKLKVGMGHETDLRRLGIMHEALATGGSRPMLMVDSNEFWSAKQAIGHIRDFEAHFDLTWAEEPARRWDYRGLRKVSQSIRAAVATGENLNDASNFMPLVHNEAVDIVQIGMGTSGITGAMQVADLAYAYELPVAMMNCPGHVMAHLAACLPNHLMMEVVAAGRDAVFDVESRIESGWLVLSDAPGLGLAFDQSKLARHAIDQPESGSGASPWGRRRGAGLYEVAPDEPDQMSAD